MKGSFGLRERQANVAVGAIVALKLATLFVLAWNRRVVMDEFVQLGWAKYLSHGLYETIWPTKALGFTIFIEPAHLIGWDARSMLLLGRMEMALLACGTLAIVYATARALGQSRLRSALIVLILLSFSNFIERIFETRGDPLSVFFAAAALLVAVRGRDRRWQIFAAGVLSGLAFLATQKAVYFNFALGVALVGDAALARCYAQGVSRGTWLVLGWLLPIIVYCFAFGGTDPLPVARNLFFGPLGVASPQTAAEYGGLRQFVVQTLVRNAILYAFCFAGMILALVKIRRSQPAVRIALIFSIIITALVFAHNQPWPYVFIMALPFMALWALEPFDAIAARPVYLPGLGAMLAVGIAGSFVKNFTYLRIDNHDQLALIDRAESLLGPNDIYFDGVAMLPNRREPSTLWLDKHAIVQTLHEGRNSDAYKIFADHPPKVILWSYRMDAIAPLVAPLIRNSYVQVAPNIRLAGQRLRLGQPTQFRVPIAAAYALYSATGEPVRGDVAIGSAVSGSVVHLEPGIVTVTLRRGPDEALLLPQGSYSGRFETGPDDKQLFAGVYN